jgi:hypothetical protein
MDTRDQVSSMTASPVTPQPSEDRSAHYTGVVLIHGIGDIKRNTTLEEAVNTLAYWFNHEAGLELRREGDGRLWLTAQLTDDPNPDAPAARAAMHLVPPGTSANTPHGDSGLQLEFREVWWAESFGLPSVAETIRWAQVQFREQAAHLLVPIGRRLGPAQTALRAPAREIAQALTYRPRADSGSSFSASASEGAQAENGTRMRLARTQRSLLTATLWLYGVLQYVWKALQWLILTPLLFLLLLLMAPLRLLALIPPLRSTVIASVSAVLEYIMLHWIAGAQVYAVDYTRSAGIRERFEREVKGFMADESCDRIVVLSHSMGTVIAYEGLTNILTPSGEQQTPKPVTFICLAQALRRVWLVALADPHRLRGVLPDEVRWLHFWARYDPVAAGPLRASSLPALDPWADPLAPDPDAALRARLERCENIDIVNTDSTFTDHTSYWQNLEQVVGPIAAELVAGHPHLEQVVGQRLATPDEILWRRWRIAWRASLAIAGGLATGIGLFLWDWQGNPQPDPGQSPFGVGHALRISLIPRLVQSVWTSLTNGPLGVVFGLISQALDAVYQAFAAQLGHLGTSSQGSTSLTIPASVSDGLYSAGAALTLTGLCIVAIGNFTGIPSPVVLRPLAGARQRTVHRVFVLVTTCLVLLAGARLALTSIFTISFDPQGRGFLVCRLAVSTQRCVPSGFSPLYGLQPLDYVPAFFHNDAVGRGVLYLGLLAGIGSVMFALADARRSKRWTACFSMVLVSLLPALSLNRFLQLVLGPLLDIPVRLDFGGGWTFPLFTGFLDYAVEAAIGIALVGCILVLADVARRRRWGWFAIILVITLFLINMLPLPVGELYARVHQIPGLREVVGTYAAFFVTLLGIKIWAYPALAALFYGLWRYRSGTVLLVEEQDRRARIALALAAVAIVGLLAISISAYLSYRQEFGPCFDMCFGDAFSIPLVGAVIVIGVCVLAASVFGVFLRDILREHRWGWLVAVVAVGLSGLTLIVYFNSMEESPHGLDFIFVSVVLNLMLPSAIAYGLWAGNGKRSTLGTPS